MSDEPQNHVVLSGRVSGEPATTVLPSGDEIVTFRLVVDRPDRARRTSRQTVDVFDCTAWTARLRRQASRLVSGDEVEVTGALRRRFHRTGSGTRSFVGVELATCVRRRTGQ